jgi:hypothetical protein
MLAFFLIGLIIGFGLYILYINKKEKSKTTFAKEREKFFDLVIGKLGCDYYAAKEFLSLIESYEQLKGINKKLEKTVKNLKVYSPS